MSGLSEKLLKLVEITTNMIDEITIMKIQIMALENNQNLLLKKLKEVKK